MRADKRFGQHFLVSEKVVRAIVGQVTGCASALEVGPGPGVLTGPLCASLGRVCAVEVDETVLPPLREAAPDAEVIVGTANSRSRVKIFSFSGGNFTQSGATIQAFGGNQNGVQVAAFDADGDGILNLAAGSLFGGTVNISVFNGSGTQQGSTFTVGNNVQTFGLGKLDFDQDSDDNLMVGTIPTGTNQITIVDATNGTVTGGFDAFPVLVGGISLDGN